LNYKITFKSSVSKDLNKIDKIKAKETLGKIETELSINAESNPVLKGKFAGLRKYRIGDYRIIYKIINKDIVLILRIALRKEVYRK
jgi:mRNA interferase RelE/StbE